MQGTLYSNMRFCRGNNYYVDSGSQSAVELGNKKYPYKSIKAAMAEIYNF